MPELQTLIEDAFENRATLTPASVTKEVKAAILQVVNQLDSGALRVAEKIDDEWHTHQWIKKAVLLYFRIEDSQIMHSGDVQYFDKVPLKFAGLDAAAMKTLGVRIVPPAVARHIDALVRQHRRLHRQRQHD
jgi:2,3,4,5-tetrahydropyridine-2-carboxylate N-succinyltransferase